MNNGPRAGDPIRLIAMPDDLDPIEPGATRIVTGVGCHGEGREAWHRHVPRTSAFRRATTYFDVRTGAFDSNVGHAETSDLRGTQSAKCGQAKEDQVQSGVRRSHGLPLQIVQHGGQFFSHEDFR
jgi:hypothetical protein